MSFDGFAPTAFEWFTDLERDNSRNFFLATREVYESDVRGALEALLEELVPEFGTSVRMFRQQRDVRFSSDKSPYKLSTYGLVQVAGKTEAGFYAQVSARGLFAGSGYRVFARDQLERYRDAVAGDDGGPDLQSIVDELESSGCDVFGEALKTAPRGHPRDHPRVRLLRHKALFAGRALEPGPSGISRSVALEHVSTSWRKARPLNGWLDRHVGAGAVDPADRIGPRRR